MKLDEEETVTFEEMKHHSLQALEAWEYKNHATHDLGIFAKGEITYLELALKT